MTRQHCLLVAEAKRAFGKAAAKLKPLIRQIEIDEPVDWEDFGRVIRETEIAAHHLAVVEEQARKAVAA
jgi:hypothetical protein